MKKSWLIFTDLDGTLLDAETYAFTEALPAIRLLQEKKIPIVPCTSKTHLEVIRIRLQIGLTDPFIVENGSAVFVPQGYFKHPISNLLMDNYEIIVLGKKHQEIWQCFKTMRQKFKIQALGFTEMTVRQIQDHTQLGEAEATVAKKRFFSEPFVCGQNLLENDRLMDFLRAQNCKLLRGNRFYHLLGDTDKGKAVNILLKLYERQMHKNFRTLGLGDSKNDIDLLSSVEQPVLIKKPSGGYGMELDLPNIYKTRKIGPAGWREAIEYFVK